MDKKIFIIPIIIIILIGTLMYFANISIYKFNMHVFKAGEADSCLITFEDKVIVIDTAKEDFFDNLDMYLQSKHINKIDYLIISNFNEEHVGGASKIINKYEIGMVFQTSLINESDSYNNYIEALNIKNIEPIIVSGDYNTSINKLEMTINGPTKEYEDNKENNSSLIVSMKYKNKKYLFLGDAMEERIEEYFNNDLGKYDVVKLPNHGNYQKIDEKIIDKYKPKHIIISSDKIDNDLKRLLKKKDIDYYLTEDNDFDLSSGYFIKIYK